MLEIQNIHLKEDKNVKIALTYIYGIGSSTSSRLLKKLNINQLKKIRDLTKLEIQKLRVILTLFILDIDLRKNLNLSIKKLIENNSYKGQRFLLKLPVNGQRTRTNARTRRTMIKK